MRKYFLIVSALLLVSGLSVNAQRFQDGFHRDNPAVIQDGDVLELVQWNSWAQNNYGASSFLYPAEDGQVLTAFHEKISAETFLGSLRQDNFTNGNLDLTLFSYAWRRGEASHRISVGVQADYRTSVPIEIFQILKQGTGQARYKMGGFEALCQSFLRLCPRALRLAFRGREGQTPCGIAVGGVSYYAHGPAAFRRGICGRY